MGYTKNIAIIRGLKNGFSSDGGELSGLIKAEKYGSFLKVEVSLINFAPLTDGRYVVGVSDGRNCCILEGPCFEGVSEVDTGRGFAALVCFVNGTVSPIASAVCGNFHSEILGIKQCIEKQERTNLLNPPIVKKSEQKAEEASYENIESQAPYEDEALAQENYYEYEQANKGGGALRPNTQKEEDGQGVDKDEAAVGTFKENGVGGLFHGGKFYFQMKEEIEKVLSSFPREYVLEDLIDNSRWVRINYGDDKYYVFGVINEKEVPQYICYGVPSRDSRRPPESLKGLASFIPAAKEGGYWVMYQDAHTGASIKIEAD